MTSTKATAGSGRLKKLVFMAALAAACSASASAQGVSNYRFAGGELVEVVVFQEQDLSGTYRVSADGRINMPLIGIVGLRGMSPSAASASIRGKLADGYLVNPQVTVRVSEYAMLRFTVLGQVGKPGALSVPANEKVTLLQAIGLAGGYTRLANTRKVIVKRSAGGSVKVHTVDAKALGGGGAGAFVIQSGDVITVSESRF